MSPREFADLALVQMEYAILAYFVIVNTFYAVLLVSAARELLDHVRRVRGEARARILGSPAAPRISILAPAYNEEATIEDSVRSLLALFYANLEIVVINDGSKDKTIGVLERVFELVPIPSVLEPQVEAKPLRQLYRSRTHPNLVVADKVNGGKADALNVGLNLASGDLVCAIDADTLIEPDALQRMVRPFLASQSIVAAGGTIRVANGCTIRRGRILQMRAPRHALAGFQVVEYLRAFLFGRVGWNRMGGNLIISGAFGLFHRDHLLAVGGYDATSIVEDLDLVVRLHRYLRRRKERYEIPFIPDPVAWTEVPESLAVLARQRGRWQRGLVAAMWQYRGMLFNPRYGRVGLIAVPFYALGEML